VHDPQKFKELFERLLQEDEARSRERNEMIRLLEEDPFNVDAQRKIEEIIRKDAVQQNLQDAIDNNPEGSSHCTRSTMGAVMLTCSSLCQRYYAVYQHSG